MTQLISCKQKGDRSQHAPDNAQRAIEGNERVLKVESSDALGVRRDVAEVADVPVQVSRRPVGTVEGVEVGACGQAAVAEVAGGAAE